MNLFVEAPWLQAKTDERVELMVKAGALNVARESGTAFLMSLLDEGSEDMTEEEQEQWERTCDNCGRYIPPETNPGVGGYYAEFYTGYTTREVDGVQIMLAFGVCGTCKESDEGNETDDH